MSATDLGQGIGAGDIDPLALTQTYLDAIDAHPMTPRIYARVTHARALAEAKAAAERAKSGFRLSPLDGVPISWKDLFDTAGTATEAGSALLKDRIPDQDAEVLQTATRLGLVCLGKTHMSELAFSGLGYNPITASSPCVNDEDAISGGSSSGAAASVAYGLAAAAIGSDTGGSVRIPAAWNDLVGLKTTSGRVSLKGVVPLCARFDTVGPLCRSVQDTAHVLAALEGGDAPDLAGADLSGMRFAILKTLAFDDIEGAPRSAFHSAVQRFQAAGANVESIEFPQITAALGLAGPLFTGEAYGTWKHVIEANPELMYAEILKRFRGGRDVLASDFVAHWQTLDQYRAEYLEATAGYDAVILPSSPIMPPNLDRLRTDDDYYVSRNILALRNTRIGNMLGLCSLTLPTGVPSTGVMLMADPFQEERLLRIGAAAELALA
ncbi:amidase [Algirhabdus cladophorae]|uniref:amidase n=1 Tax=Algirhabdus cladophorae TaxID=3377108 RepID=UPI003B84ACE4